MKADRAVQSFVRVGAPQRFLCRIIIMVSLFALTAIHDPPLYSQESGMRFRRLSIDEGLSNPNVLSIAQDSLGFIWIGTEDGLNRYDGYSVKVYKSIPNDSTSISSRWISALCVDSGGIVWVGTNKGLNRYDRARDGFTRFLHNPDDTNSPGSDAINQITIDRQGHLLIATYAGLDVFDNSTNRFTHYRFDSGDSQHPASASIGRIIRDSRGGMWASVWKHGLGSFDPGTGTFAAFPVSPADSSGPSGDLLTWLTEGDDGSIWIAVWQSGVNRLDRATNRFTYYTHRNNDPGSFGDTSATVLNRRRSGGMWIGTYDNGLDIFDPATGTFHHNRNSPVDPQSLSSNRVTALCEDHDGRLWVGTTGGGVSIYDPWRKLFDHIRPGDDLANGLNDRTVWAMCEDRRGVVWIGTENGGLNRYDPHSNRFAHFLHDPKNPHSLSGNFVKALCEDRFGVVWAGTTQGVDRMDRDGRFIHYHHDSLRTHSLGDDDITVIYEDHDGELWVATHHGLARYDRAHDEFVRYIYPASVPAALMEREIQFIHQDIRGEIWIGTFGDGIYVLDKKTNTMSHYAHPAIPDNGCYAIDEDKNGNIWVSMFGGGLSVFNRATGSFRNYSEQDGLPSNFVKGILSDDRGNLWLSTTKGLSRFNPGEGAFRNFGTGEGIQANEFRTGSCFKARDGKMYFGGVNGYNVFHPDSIRLNPIPPPVVLTSFKVFDTPFPLDEPVAKIDRIQLEYSQDAFSFEFVAFNFTNSEKNLYAYKMEGFDKEWVNCGTRRYANYTHLDPGPYLFRVKASNNDGVWNETGSSVEVIVVPPYWMTWWFRLTAILFVFGAVAWAVRSVEMRKIAEKMQRLEREAALERERTRIARDMHDDLGARLTEIRLLSELTQRDLSDDRTAKSNLRDISEGARDIVDSFQEIVWSVNPRYDTLDNFADFLTQYSSGYLAKSGLRCRLDIPAIVPGLKVSAEIRHNMMMVVKEALNNAVKHASASEVSLRLTCDDHRLIVAIRDDGVGFAEDGARRFGDGLANMRRRLESIGGEIHIDTSPGAGTTVTLSVALSEPEK